jgi:hypothetical protein
MRQIHTLTMLAALCAPVLPTIAVAQASEPQSVAASAPAPQQPSGPRVLTPADQRNKAAAAAAPDLRPDRPVVPQISVPLGRTPPVPSSPASRPPRSGAAPPPGHIGDGAARCESLPGDLERATCRKRLAETKPPA